MMKTNRTFWERARIIFAYNSFIKVVINNYKAETENIGHAASECFWGLAGAVWFAFAIIIRLLVLVAMPVKLYIFEPVYYAIKYADDPDTIGRTARAVSILRGQNNED